MSAKINQNSKTFQSRAKCNKFDQNIEWRLSRTCTKTGPMFNSTASSWAREIEINAKRADSRRTGQKLSLVTSLLTNGDEQPLALLSTADASASSRKPRPGLTSKYKVAHRWLRDIESCTGVVRVLGRSPQMPKGGFVAAGEVVDGEHCASAADLDELGCHHGRRDEHKCRDGALQGYHLVPTRSSLAPAPWPPLTCAHLECRRQPPSVPSQVEAKEMSVWERIRLGVVVSFLLVSAFLCFF
jgi:hypothetical protein